MMEKPKSSYTRKTLEALVLAAAIAVPAGLLTKIIMYQNHTRNEIEKCSDNDGDGIDDGRLFFTEEKLICLPSKALKTIGLKR